MEVTLALLIILGFSGLVVGIPASGRKHHAMLDESGRYNVSWWFDQEEIAFEVTVRTTGWVGFGLSPSGAMTGSDIVLGWVKNGQGVLHDMYAVGNGRPMQDTKTDWHLSRASENGGITTLEFHRKRRSCDEQHDMDIPEGTARVIFAWGSSDPAGDVTTASYHVGNRGTRSFQLLNPLSTRTPLPADTWNIDFTFSNVAVPGNKQTTYWCGGFTMPKLTQTNHIIRVSPIITPGNEAVVHHLILRYCNIAEENATLFHGVDGRCNERASATTDKRRSEMEENCQAPLVAYAIGGGDFDFPPHVGFPVGPGYGPYVVYMEMHYDNPQLKTGIVDSSGLRLHLTPTLRPEQAALAMVGSVVMSSHVIPPHIPSLVTRGYCPRECIQKGLAGIPQGVKIFSSVLHSHLLGRKMVSRIVRDGKEVGSLGRENFYDFNFQELRSLPREVTLMPGDEIVTDCVYDSRERNFVTYGGLGTEEEMCINFFYYYPRGELSVCSTAPEMTGLFNFFGVIQVDYSSGWPYKALLPADKAGKTLRQLFDEHDWSGYATQRAYQQLILSSQINMYTGCYSQSGDAEMSFYNETHPYHMAPFQEQAPEPRPSYCAQAPGTTKDPTGVAVQIGGNVNYVMILALFYACLFH